METTKQLQSMNMRTGKTKALAKSAKSILLLLAMLVMGQAEAWADAITEDFSTVTTAGTAYYGSYSELSNGWKIQGGYVGTSAGSHDYDLYASAGHNAVKCIEASYGSSNSAFIVVPVELSGEVSFWVAGRNYNYNGSYTINKVTESEGTYTKGEQIKTGTVTKKNSSSAAVGTWTEITADLGDGPVMIGITLVRAALDDFSATKYELPNGPALTVKDGSTKMTSPYAYDFGLATAGTTKTFTLSNPGTAAVEGLSVSETGSFGATLSATSIAVGGEATLTITMPSTTGTSNSTITISSTTEGIADFVINASGTVRDPNKVYLDFSDGTIPDGWTSVAIGSWASEYGSPWAASAGYVSQSGSSSSYEWAFTSPKLTFTEGETIFFETAKYGSSDYTTPSIKVEYSTDGSSWTTIGSAFTDDVYGTWTKRSVTIPTADAKYIRFSGWYIHMRNIYGGELPIEPKMVVTQPASLDYGVIATNTAKTFTIANTGLAALTGINVTSSNAAFAVTGAPTSLAAGASKEVTITMSAATKGAFSSDITVSATGMENVVFTVTGVVLPDGMNTETFDSGLPTNWTNASWTIADGTATGKSSSAYLTTPKLIFSEGDLLVIKAKRYDSDATDYITVQGSSDNGTTWTAYSKKISGSDGLAYPDYGTIVLSDIPTTVNKLRFVGYYVVVDEIAGLTYAPVLSVTTGDPATTVTTPAAYDFGECAANVSVTYNFANVGAGTINITNVTITGDGAAAYSTNWTESAAPFDLTITRSYDAERAGAAQAAVVTVTTTEGAFVINVTGTDKAANAPELAVTLGGEAVTTGDAANFGSQLKAAPAAKTYTITNSGTGTLTGTIATSDDTKFTVSKTSFSLAAAESTTFDLALVFDTNYGAKAATITIHPAIDGLEDIVINATASTLDPEAWTEDFAGGTLPMGWEANTWTIGSDSNYENKTTMALAPGSSTAGTIITPCLTAKKDDILTWDAYFKWADESLIVEYSTDNKITWNPYVTVYGTASGEKGSGQVYYHKEMSFTAPADGDYYLRFTSTYNNGIDNFAGFKLNLPDHIMVISANTIPASTSNSVTMKEGQSFDATVTVKETRGVAETGVVAKLYMGSTVIGTSVSTDFEANESKVITIPCTPTTSAVDGIKMHIEVEYAGGKLSTENVTRYVAAITYLTLDETSSDAVVAGTYDHVTLKRKFNKDWNTVCLPFTINDVEAFFGAGAKAYNFTSYSNGELGFTSVTTLTASYPYIVYVPAAITENIALTDITIASGDASAWYRYQSGAYFRGTYAPIAAGGWTKNADTDNIYGVTSEGKIAKAGASATMKGFRAYFDLPAGVTAPSLSVQDQTTGITTIVSEGSQQNGEVYNLNGQKVNAPGKGLYIINGRKVVVK